MKYSTLTDGQGSHPSQFVFLEQQRQHPCTDCGHSYLAANANTVSEGPNFHRKTVGGGTIVSSKHGLISEVHIVPHGGTELPQDLLDELDPDQLPALSELVHENADIGTGAIYRTLVEDVISGESKGVVVAGFHLSRILLDANRAKVEEQMPLHPYVGSADIYAEYLRRRGYDLREEALLPWLDAIGRILHNISDGVVYHHHTYDVASLSPRPWDQGPYIKRPAFQLVWRKPSWDAVFDHNESSIEDGLAPLKDIEGVRDRIHNFLQAEIGLEDSSGAIDYPLRLPVAPFPGTRSGDPFVTPHHVMYDLRKDVLVTEKQIQLWVAIGPWRVAPK